jgi:hypothetical protein
MANESKERLLAAAKELFLARGYAGTTVDAICEKAELTKGSFYHFSIPRRTSLSLYWSGPFGEAARYWEAGGTVGSLTRWRRRLPSLRIWRTFLQSFGVADVC